MKSLYQWDYGKEWVFIDPAQRWIGWGCGFENLNYVVKKKDVAALGENFDKWFPMCVDGETMTYKLPEDFFR